MYQSITSVFYATPGNRLVVLEGHRFFESQALMDMGDYVVFLTTTQAVSRARKTTQLSLDLYGQRLAPFLAAVHDSNKIPKLDASAPALKANIIKNLIAFTLLKDLGLRQEKGEYSSTHWTSWRSHKTFEAKTSSSDWSKKRVANPC